MKETWRAIIGFEGLYEVSDMGRVRNRHGKIMVATPRRKDKYWQVPLSRNHTVKRAYLHRIVAEAFKGLAPSDEHEVAHDDGDKARNTAKNLIWKTRSQNAEDNRRHGVMSMGEAHGMSVFTVRGVLEARRLKTAKVPERAIAKQIGVSRWTLRGMLAGRTWTHV